MNATQHTEGAPAPLPPFKCLSLAGRCANGNERGHGRLVHAVTDETALCGATYGSRSAGWGWREYEAVTCPRSLKRIENAGKPRKPRERLPSVSEILAEAGKDVEPAAAELPPTLTNSQRTLVCDLARWCAVAGHTPITRAGGVILYRNRYQAVTVQAVVTMGLAAIFSGRPGDGRVLIITDSGEAEAARHADLPPHDPETGEIFDDPPAPPLTPLAWWDAVRSAPALPAGCTTEQPAPQRPYQADLFGPPALQILPADEAREVRLTSGVRQVALIVARFKKSVVTVNSHGWVDEDRTILFNENEITTQTTRHALRVLLARGFLRVEHRGRGEPSDYTLTLPI